MMTCMPELPTRLMLCPWGETTDINGNVIIVNEQTLRGFDAAQKAVGGEEIALDFGHNSHVADRDPGAEPVKVASYGAPVIEEGVGIQLDLSAGRWTPEGREFYGEGHYRDVSPVLSFYEGTNVVKGVSSAALCRRGALDGLVAFSADFLTQQNKRDTKKQNMDTENINGGDANTTNDSAILDRMGKAMTDILGKLGVKVPDGASREEVLKAVAEWLKSGTAPAGAEAPEKAYSAQLAGMQRQIDELAAQKATAEKSALIDAAVRQGKRIGIAREKLETAFSVDQLTVYLDSLQEGEVPFSATSSREQTPGKATVTEEQREALRQCGLTEEEFLKYRS